MLMDLYFVGHRMTNYEFNEGSESNRPLLHPNKTYLLPSRQGAAAGMYQSFCSLGWVSVNNVSVLKNKLSFFTWSDPWVPIQQKTINTVVNNWVQKLTSNVKGPLPKGDIRGSDQTLEQKWEAMNTVYFQGKKKTI